MHQKDKKAYFVLLLIIAAMIPFVLAMEDANKCGRGFGPDYEGFCCSAECGPGELARCNSSDPEEGGRTTCKCKARDSRVVGSAVCN